MRVLNEIVNTVDLYSNWFGPLAHKLGFTFIQVPENYGAQADVTAVIQDAVAFKGVENLDRVYHELSHQWNVKPLDQFSPRWNEGLATFLQALVLDKIHIPGHLDKETALTIKYLKKVFLKNPKYRTTPYIDYGKESLNSYSVGMIFFRLLFDVLGQKEFNSLTGSFYQKFQKQGATTQDFIDYFKMNSTKNINDVFEDWAYGTIYIEMLEKKASYAQILAHYKK